MKDFDEDYEADRSEMCAQMEYCADCPLNYECNGDGR